METLDGVGHGTTLAGRYRLDEPQHLGGGGTLWRAVDTTLDRVVGVRFVGGDAAADALDAARRASVVDDPRLVRVLDVGTETVDLPGGDAVGVGYVVSELVDGESLAARLQRGPMPAPAVRAVVGEAAQALERARGAGLHHACLTPARLVLVRDGGVKISGLAVDAALDPDAADRQDGTAAARADAVGLVALLYAGLTARWPLGEVEELPAAPHVEGQPVPPADLVPGVPNDLDTLCAVTFGPHDDGPRTPGELAEQLAPWGREPSAADRDDDLRRMRPAGRFPVRLVGTAGAVGAAAAAAASAAGVRPEQGAGTVTRGGQHLFPRPEDDPGGPDEVAAEEPDPPQDAGPAGRRYDSAIVLALVAVLVVVGLAFAVSSLSTFGESDPAAAPSVAPPQTPTPEPTPEPAPEPTEDPATEPAQPPARIQGVRTLDPQGDDGTENDDQAPLAIDDDPGTAWTSSTYSTAGFGNLKDGVGMVVDLGRPSALNAVQLAVNGSGGEVEVRAAPGPALDDSQVLGTAAIEGDPIDVTLEEPVETRYVVLWFTRLPDTGDGFRIELAQVQVQ